MAIDSRYDFVILFDVENGNPNGDPDAGNTPRVDAETGHGFVTDVCLKRKIRNYVRLCQESGLAPEEGRGYNILIKPDRSLNAKFQEACERESVPKNKDRKNADDMLKAQGYMCRNYYDVRAFGAVMSTGDYSCGIVRGPVQINFARSLSPVYIEDITITRQARTTDERTETGNTEMAKKSIIPYGLYRAEGYISAALANKTGFNEADLELLWTAIINMFEHDHSAARGKVCMRKLYIFKHENVLGNCPSHVLFDKIVVRERSENVPPRKFDDYEIVVDESMPHGVERIDKL